MMRRRGIKRLQAKIIGLEKQINEVESVGFDATDRDVYLGGVIYNFDCYFVWTI